jgi:hypothetical protein
MLTAARRGSDCENLGAVVKKQRERVLKLTPRGSAPGGPYSRVEPRGERHVILRDQTTPCRHSSRTIAGIKDRDSLCRACLKSFTRKKVLLSAPAGARPRTADLKRLEVYTPTLLYTHAS